MRLSTVLLAAVGITTSLAQIPTTLNNPNDEIDINSDDLEDETDINENDDNNNRASNSKCSRSASSLLRSTPTPSPTDFRSWFSSTYLLSTSASSGPTTSTTTSITTGGGGPNALGCAPTDIPASLSSDFENYRTRLSKSWYARKSSSIRKLLKSCSTQTITGVRKVRTLAAMVTGGCGVVSSQTTALNTALPTTTTTTTTSTRSRTTTAGADGGSLPTSSTSTGGGGGLPRATGLGSLGGAIVVGAVAGVVGVVAF